VSERDKLLDRFLRVQGWLYGGGKGDDNIEYIRIAAVVTRHPHKCCSPYHDTSPKEYPARTLMIVENAKFDGQFRSAYTCESCIRESEKELR